MMLCGTSIPTSFNIFAECHSARHPNSAAHSRFVMFVCQSCFRNSIIVTLRNSGRSVEELVRAHASNNVCDFAAGSWRGYERGQKGKEMASKCGQVLRY